MWALFVCSPAILQDCHHDKVLKGHQTETRLGALTYPVPVKANVLCIVHCKGHFSSDVHSGPKKQRNVNRGTKVVETPPIELIRKVPLDYIDLALFGATRKLPLPLTKGPGKGRLGPRVKQAWLHLCALNSAEGHSASHEWNNKRPCN